MACGKIFTLARVQGETRAARYICTVIVASFHGKCILLNGGFVGGFELRHFLFTVVKPAVILLASVFSAEMQQQEDKKLTL